MATKVCKKCGIEKDVSCFPKRADFKDGFYSLCKLCMPKVVGGMDIKEYKKIYMKKYRQLKKRELYDYANNYRKKRREKDIEFKLSLNLRRATSIAIHKDGGQNSIKYNILLGCTNAFLVEYIQSQFDENMTWDNYGLGEDKWTIDHIIPFASFDLTDPEQQKICCNYTNLQPMWFLDNVLKSDKIITQKLA